MPQLGVFVGRLCPPHLGHQAVISQMIEKCESTLVVVGSSNHDTSLRHFFSYEERRRFLKELFSELRIVGLGDYQTDEEWFVALDDLIQLANPTGLSVVFFGGCREDTLYYEAAGREVAIVNRFSGVTPKVSATEVRDALISQRELAGLVDERLAPLITETFKRRWEQFKKM